MDNFIPENQNNWANHLNYNKMDNITTAYLLYMIGLTMKQHRNCGLMQAFSGRHDLPETIKNELLLAVDYSPEYALALEREINKYETYLQTLDNIYVKFKETAVLDELSPKKLYAFSLKPLGKKIVDTVWEGKYTQLPEPYKTDFFLSPSAPASNNKKAIVSADKNYREKWAHIWGIPIEKCEDWEMEAKPVPYKDIFNHPFDFETIKTGIENETIK